MIELIKKEALRMKRTGIKLTSLALALSLVLLSLSGCTFLSDLNDAILGLYDKPDEPEASEFKLEELINEITTSKIRSTVKLETKYFNQNLWGDVTDYAISQGSGTLIMRGTALGSTKCYVLTNAHCVDDNKEYARKKITVTDYCGNIYEGAAVYLNSISEKYDLAIVEFNCSNNDVQPIALADKNPRINGTVISLGTPHSQMNSITVGKVTTYYKSKLIEVDALYHTAPVGPGGSGGALLNTELELCGVNFAADETEEDFGNGSSVPIEAVREYLATFEIFNLILN